MSTAIQLVFTVVRAPVIAARLGSEQTLVIDANVNDPPMPRVDGRVQHDHRGRRHAATVHGRWREGEIETPYISGLDRPYWREFFESTDEAERFRLVHPDFFGWDGDVSDLTVYRPLNSASLPRFDLGDNYRARFRWRETSS